jgi:hypothetical protein
VPLRMTLCITGMLHCDMHSNTQTQTPGHFEAPGPSHLVMMLCNLAAPLHIQHQRILRNIPSAREATCSNSLLVVGHRSPARRTITGFYSSFLVCNLFYFASQKPTRIQFPCHQFMHLGTRPVSSQGERFHYTLHAQYSWPQSDFCSHSTSASHPQGAVQAIGGGSCAQQAAKQQACPLTSEPATRGMSFTGVPSLLFLLTACVSAPAHTPLSLPLLCLFQSGTRCQSLWQR